NFREVIVHQIADGEKHPVVERQNALHTEVGHELAVSLVVISLADEPRQVHPQAELPFVEIVFPADEQSLRVEVERREAVVAVVIPLARDADGTGNFSRAKVAGRRRECGLHGVDKHRAGDGSRLLRKVGVVAEKNLAVEQDVKVRAARVQAQDALRADVLVFTAIQFLCVRAGDQTGHRHLEFPRNLVVLQLLHGGGLRVQNIGTNYKKCSTDKNPVKFHADEFEVKQRQIQTQT